MIHLKCPHCEKALKIKDRAAGTKVSCPSCTHPFFVPQTSSQPDPPVPDRFADTTPLSLPWKEIVDDAHERDDEQEEEHDEPRHKPKSSNRGVWIGVGVGGSLLLVLFVTVAIILVVQARKNRDDAIAPTDVAERENAGIPWVLNLKDATPSQPALTVKEKEAADEAIKALGRIEAAVEVGVIFQQYTKLVIDAKAAVNEAERIVPACEQRTNIRGAMDAYGDASLVWSDKLRFPRLELDEKLGDGELISRYKLVTRDKERAMQIIWVVGKEKLARARALQ